MIVIIRYLRRSARTPCLDGLQASSILYVPLDEFRGRSWLGEPLSIKDLLEDALNDLLSCAHFRRPIVRHRDAKMMIVRVSSMQRVTPTDTHRQQFGNRMRTQTVRSVVR